MAKSSDFPNHTDMTGPIFKAGHNSPPHMFVADWFYMLTASVYKQQPLIRSSDRKAELVNALYYAAEIYHWAIIAWVVMDNHYHAILKSPLKSPDNLPNFVASYHKFLAHRWNNQENLSGRMVWCNYWDTCIRSNDDYLNRLRYIFWNPVKHGLAQKPEDYTFCNYDDFLDKVWFVQGKTQVEVDDVPES